MTKVLVVDDEPQIRRALSLNLGARGYEVFEAATGEMALAASAIEHPDIVLLDLGLPGIDGATVLAALRGWTKVPVIVLTVRDDERSKVQLLDAGADDYITKPFGMAELIARMRAVLRRVPDAPDMSAEVVTEQFRLDLAAHRAFAGPEGAEVRLTPIEWEIVIRLVRNPNRLITYRQLFTTVWGPTFDPDNNLLRVHMAHIRHKLERNPGEPRYFITDVGSGYRFQIDNGGPGDERPIEGRPPEQNPR
jgi:two-component system, OmpR family, KDP operon response regulator KdpE